MVHVSSVIVQFGTFLILLNLAKNTPMAYSSIMLIIETSIFTRLIQGLMDDDQYRALQEALILRPDLGDLIKGSGGIRKVRWRIKDKGKSGGVRVIYYWAVSEDQIRMLYVYGKSRQPDLTPSQIATLKEIVQRWSDE
jgi:hypothetical protein